MTVRDEIERLRVSVRDEVAEASQRLKEAEGDVQVAKLNLGQLFADAMELGIKPTELAALVGISTSSVRKYAAMSEPGTTVTVIHTTLEGED